MCLQSLIASRGGVWGGVWVWRGLLLYEVQMRRIEKNIFLHSNNNNNNKTTLEKTGEQVSEKSVKGTD